MFSAKNYGLPKDLIEAAKKVHEKQLEEQQKPTSLGQAVERVGLAIKGVIPKKATKPSAKDVYKAMGGTEPKRAKKPQAKEVQFTEEELAEAFAIFLEENFHVEMLTEEDLDYVFENEFPQWLEEVFGLFGTPKPKPSSRTGVRPEVHMGDTVEGGNISTRKYQAQSAVEKASKSGTLATTGSGQTDIISKTKQDVTTDAIKGDTVGGETSASVPTQKPTPRKQVKVSAKPAVSARKSAPKIDYKTPVTRRGPDGTYGLTSKGRKYVARKEAQERKKPFSASKFFSQMQRDGN